MATRVSRRFKGFNLKNILCKIAIFKEVDYGSAWMRADCIASDSIGVLAPVAGADVRIVSPVLNYSANTERTVMYDSGSDEFEPFLDTFSLIDRYSYIGVFATIFTVLALVSFETRERSSHQRIVKRVFKQFGISFWYMFALILRQGGPSFRTALLKMVWLTMTIGFFILSSGYFLNLLGTEQVAKRSPDQIETLNDVISQKFEHVEPTMVTNAFTYAMNQLVKPGSKEEKVFQKLRRHDWNFISVDSGQNKNNQTIPNLAMETMRDKARYWLFEEILVTQMKPVLCHFSPENAKTLRTSLTTILGGVLVAPYAKTMNVRLKKYTEYRLENQFEMGISTYELRDLIESVAQLTGQWAVGKPNSTLCLLELTEDGRVADTKFKLGNCRIFLRFLACMLVFALAVNLVEAATARKSKAKVVPEPATDVKSITIVVN
ncbi:hypothetical protein HDE_00982 [Halotydeus destructor]|nr:hypothetical protein HDE_00982 [Halotydeus destructor]